MAINDTMKRTIFTFLGVIWALSCAYAQTAVIQSGPQAPGRVPMYIGSGSQPVVKDSGPASGGGPGVGLSELGITARGSGTAPYAGKGSGLLAGAHFNLSVPPGGSATDTLTVDVNGAPTSITCTITGSSSFCDIAAALTAAIARGQTYDVKLVGSSGAAATLVNGSIGFIP